VKLESECTKILLAADEPDVCSLYGQMLEGNGYDFQDRVDGQDALEIAIAGSFDLLVLDLNVPRLDGFKVMTRLKEAGKVLPVIMMTGHFSEQVVEDRLEGLQVVEVLRKPVMITTCFERSHAGDLVYSDGSNR
jgi:CheY-like chemotaxis protein